MTAADITELAEAADGGDRAAMTKLGKLALIGEGGGRSPGDGTKLLLAAAEAGDAEADAVISVLIGADAKELSDWALALDYLGRSAARGWPAARKQFALLCTDRDLAKQSETQTPPSDIWRRMSQCIDIAAMLRFPPERIAFETPRIAVIEGFASPAECAWMIARARPGISRAGVFDQQHGGGTYQNARSNSAMMFNILDADFVLVLLRARMVAATGIPGANFEETNVLHYAPGQAFGEHYDFLDPERPGLKDEIAGKGQRVLTFLIYLNGGFEGGETDFVKLGWRYRGGVGDAILFRNVDASGAPDPQTRHAGRPPASGEKWLLSQWIRSRPPRRAGETE
jgi:prolyl 4-hydroxylase